MRFRFMTVAILLAVASRANGRPRDPDPLDSNSSKEAVAANLGAVSRNGNSDSRHEQHRKFKDIQHMDQSLRTVATQLLNSTAKREDLVRIPEEKIVTIETPMQVVHITTRVEDAVSSNSNEEENESSKMKFGIPVNSKFSHLEMSNPGHAMAMTEEEIERELSAVTAQTQKNQPTTASMLSTWIQLYPPAVTTEGNNVSDVKDIQSNQIFSSTSTKLPSTAIKQNSANTKPIRKTETKPTTDTVTKTTEPSVSTTKFVKKTNTNPSSNYVKISTTASPISSENDVDQTLSTGKKPSNQRTTVSAATITKSTLSTKKPATKATTTKPKVTAVKNSGNKPSKGNNSSNRGKPFSTRRPANKTDTVTSTSKIEKVTLKPSTISSKNSTANTDKPHFVTKIKASVLAESLKTTTAAPTTVKQISKSNYTNSETSTTKLPNPTRVNNILNVHLKKPTEDKTKIEIQPIRVSPPVLTIEKIEDNSSEQKINTEDQDILENSKIDLKFDFDSEVGKVEVQTESSPSSTSTTTTKRSRPSNKRKKNKNRRRKQSTTTTTTLATPISSTDNEELTTLSNGDFQLVQEIQESKIEPESKAPPSKKKKPNQTQVQKPIGTQIYNFLSREVMPSVGVMSLVGLGLGLASYFLYPFGGVITRRNYNVEPNYKYNLDEYGGNYGLSEEEVLSKVYSGMTGGQYQESKYNSAVVGEKNPNYYRYTVPEKPPQQTARYPNTVPQKKVNRVAYRPVETTSYETKYRNTEFKYPDVPTTMNYYERQRQQQSNNFVSMVNKVGIGHNRQFVVGNVPKEYSSADVDKKPDMLPVQDKVDPGFQHQTSESYSTSNAPISSLSIPKAEHLGNPAALVSNIGREQSDEVYDDMEINPTAVAVEYGPRSLKIDNDVNTKSKFVQRKKRGILPEIGSLLPIAIPNLNPSKPEKSSVIQVIPPKSEIEKERKLEQHEEDLSNEILDIIDEAMPGKPGYYKKKYDGKDPHAVNKQYNKDLIDNTIQGSSPTTTISNGAGSSSTISMAQQPTNSASSSTSTTTTTTPTEPDFVDQGETTLDWQENVKTTVKPTTPQPNKMDIFGIAKRIAEFKLRLGLTILKHASEGFARYIGHIQKRFNGEE